MSTRIGTVGIFTGASLVAQFALGVSEFRSSMAAKVLWLLTAALLVWLLFKLVNERRSRVVLPVATGQSTFMPLREVACELYAEARRSWPIWSRAAEGLSGPNMTNGSEDEILNWVATWIRRRVELHGARPPSARTELIEDMHGQFEGGARVYRSTSNEYRTLFVLTADVPRLIDEIKTGGTAPNPTQRSELQELQRMQGDADQLHSLTERRAVLDRSKLNLTNFVREAKDQFQRAEIFVRTVNEASPNTHFSGTAAMHPELFERLTKLIRRAIEVAKESGFASGFEAPEFVAPPDIHLRQINQQGDTVFYKIDNWPYVAELARYIDRSAKVIKQLDGPLFLIEEELKSTDEKIDAVRARLSQPG